MRRTYESFKAEQERLKAELAKIEQAHRDNIAAISAEWEKERTQHVTVLDSIRQARQRTIAHYKDRIHELGRLSEEALCKAKAEIEAEHSRYGTAVKSLERRIAKEYADMKKAQAEYAAAIYVMAGVPAEEEGGEA